jgi:glutamyl/glutaminyl-tRNA synthetase
VADLRARGYPADAVLNYLSLLGWSDPDGREVLTRDELVRGVSLDRVGRADTQMDPDKLAWIAQQHVAAEDVATLAGHVAPFLDRARFPHAAERLEAVVDALHTRLRTYGDINEQLPVLDPAADVLNAAGDELAGDPAARNLLQTLANRLAEVEPWQADPLGRVVREAGAAVGVRGATLFHPLRKALIGAEKGPDIGKILAALGRKEALRRISAGIERRTV